MKTEFKILHLSDIHLHNCESKKLGDERGNRQDTVNSFLDLTKDKKYDLVAITGDFFDGPFINNMDFNECMKFAQFFFDKIQELAKKGATIVMCFGNHDLKLYYKVDKEELFKYTANNDLDEFFVHLENEREKEKERLKEKYPTRSNDKLFWFRDFIQKFINDGAFVSGKYDLKNIENLLFYNFQQQCPAINQMCDSEYKTFGVHYFENNNIAVAYLNSSWQNIASDLLDGKISLGRFQVNYIKDKLDKIKAAKPSRNIYVLTLMHNAFNSLRYEDVHSSSDTPSLISTVTEFSDLILCGHEHGELPPSLIHLESYQLKTGGLLNYEKNQLGTNKIKNSFSEITLDFEKRELKRELFVFDESKKIFSNQNKDNFISLLNNCMEFELFPKIGKEYIINQQRSIEEYFQFMKEFDYPYQGLGDKMLIKGIRQKITECQVYYDFFNEKEKIRHEIIKNKVSKTIDSIYTKNTEKASENAKS
ncbi:metallophosphoesterase [Ferruginibacter sp.]|nr:metallophosphoesterase [Ferruginibacter sp.]